MVLSLRPFRREKYGVSFALELAEWPNDVPLPHDATESVRGPKRLPPRREIDLKARQTIDRVRGLFDVPQSLETVTEWYRHEMKPSGSWKKIAVWLNQMVLVIG